MGMIFSVIRTCILMAFPVFASLQGNAQQDSSQLGYKRFSILVGSQFHNFALPFKDMESSFTHPGLLLGSEIAYNDKNTLIQQATVGGYLNREIGNGIFVSTQFGYLPRIFDNFYGVLKVGVSFLRVFHPTQAYEYTQGEWKETIGGKSQLGFPVDVGFGYSLETGYGQLSPFMAYQVTPALFYNETLPVTIYTTFIVGLRIKLLASNDENNSKQTCL